MGLHTLDLNDLPDQREIEKPGRAFTPHRDRDLASLGAAHLLHRLDQAQVFGQLVLDLDNLIAGLDARAVGRRVLDRRHHGQHAVTDGDLDPQSTKAAFGIDLQLLIQLGSQIGAMRVQSVQHAIDRALDQLLGADFFHVVFLHDRQDIGKRF